MKYRSAIGRTRVYNQATERKAIFMEMPQHGVRPKGERILSFPYTVRVTFIRCGGSSGSRPSRRAVASASR